MQDQSANAVPPPLRTRSRSITLFVALIAFILGAALVAWAASRGYLSHVVRTPETEESTGMLAEPTDGPTATSDEATAPASQSPTEQMTAIGSVEGRLAMLEDRLSRIDFQAQAASGNAARAEGLLIAFAARRTVDRGEPLNYIADQLRLRFMNAQPRAVETVIAFSRNPVTLDELTARLEALSPDLTDIESRQSVWDRARNEIGSLFMVHRDSPALASPLARIGRAKVMLVSRRIDNAIDEVERLPGAEAANTWIADARRYQDAQRALDLLETTAMLEPSRLQDAQGHKVDQPSPLAGPVATDAGPNF